MNYKIVQIAALALASASLFGADENVGGQVPIVFAGCGGQPGMNRSGLNLSISSGEVSALSA